MECLDADVVKDLVAGALPAPARAAALAHLDGCGACRDRVGPLARPRDIALVDTVATAGGGGDIGVAFDATAAPGEPTRPVVIRTPSQAGRTLGRYTLVERLGAGAMGVVYRAEDRELGRSVALKQLHRPDPSLTDRLVREAQSMAKVNHPNVVAVYDVGVAEGVTYIAMELVQGQSLRAWQHERRTIHEILVAYIAAGRGLAAAHAAGIVHRDFKPDNCLVGGDGRVRVTDFGLAALRPAAGDEDPAGDDAGLELTAAGSVLGTPAYMAPEQFLGGNVDSRTDQFNFCVALYEALYNQRPFDGRTFEELGNHVCDGKVRPAPAGSRVSRALRAIVLRGLSVMPGDRFPSMEYLLAELGRDRARPWRRTAIAAAAFAAVLGLGLIADYVVRGRITAQAQQSFAATGTQIDRAFRLLTDRFGAFSTVAYLQPQVREVASHYDQADFGLGDSAADREGLADLHELLASADWVSWARKLDPGVLGIADKKGRLLFTSADLTTWGADVSGLEPVKHLLEANKDGSAIGVLRDDAPALVSSQLLGGKRSSELSVIFASTFAPGNSIGALFLQLSAGRDLLDEIRLDDDTLLALVAPDGTYVPASVSEQLVRSARPGEIVEIRDRGETYQVQARPLTSAGKPIASVVMARPIGGVLSGLFPGARSVFALAMCGATLLALGTALRARQITGARV